MFNNDTNIEAAIGLGASSIKVESIFNNNGIDADSIKKYNTSGVDIEKIKKHNNGVDVNKIKKIKAAAQTSSISNSKSFRKTSQTNSHPIFYDNSANLESIINKDSTDERKIFGNNVVDEVEVLSSIETTIDTSKIENVGTSSDIRINRYMEYSSSTSTKYTDSFSFEKQIEKEKAEKEAQLKKVFKQTLAKIEVLNESQLNNLLEQLKRKQEEYRNSQNIVKFLKVSSKIEAIQNYIMN